MTREEELEYQLNDYFKFVAALILKMGGVVKFTRRELLDADFSRVEVVRLDDPIFNTVTFAVQRRF